MKANLEWINQQWELWLQSDVGRKLVGTGRVKEHPEHIAKLFSAFVAEQLPVNDLAVMVRRLCARIDRDLKRGTVDPANRVILDQAYGLLGRNDLLGSPLREDVPQTADAAAQEASGYPSY